MVEAHTDTSSLRPYVKPIKELPDPTIRSLPTPININSPFPTDTMPETSTDPREALKPFDPTATGETSIFAVENARKTVIGLSVGIILALILTGTVIYIVVLKYRKAGQGKK